RLVERLGLGQLLRAPMEQADVRVGTLHDLAVHLQDQAQHAVRGRMLRAEVERVVADLLRELGPAAGEGFAGRARWRLGNGAHFGTSDLSACSRRARCSSTAVW